MSTFDESPSWPGVRRIETGDPVLGGVGGTDNLAPEQLTQRDAWLRRMFAEQALTQWQVVPLLTNAHVSGVITTITAAVKDATHGLVGGQPRLALALGDGKVARGISWASPTGILVPVWTPVEVDTVNHRVPLSIAYGAGIWVVVGEDGLIASSPDLAAWTIRSTDVYNFQRVIYDAPLGRFIAVGVHGGIWWSSDGITWHDVSVADVSAFFVDVACSTTTGRLRVVNYNGTIYKSDDGATWTLDTPARGDVGYFSVAWGNGWWVVIGMGIGVGAVPLLLNDNDGIGWRDSGESVVAAVDGLRLAYVPQADLFVGGSFQRPGLWIGARNRWRRFALAGVTPLAVVSTPDGVLVTGNDGVVYRSAAVDGDIGGGWLSWV